MLTVYIALKPNFLGGYKSDQASTISTKVLRKFYGQLPTVFLVFITEFSKCHKVDRAVLELHGTSKQEEPGIMIFCEKPGLLRQNMRRYFLEGIFKLNPKEIKKRVINLTKHQQLRRKF